MKSRLLPLGAIVLITVLALFIPIFRTFVREAVVIPLLYLFWIGRFLFQIIPQAVLWTFFFIIFLLIMGVGLIGQKKAKKKSLRFIKEDQGRIEEWANLIHKAEDDKYFQWRLAQRLQKVTLSAIAHNRRQTIKQTRQQLRQGRLDIPPELEAYFLAGLQSLSHLSPPKRLFGSKTKSSPLDLDLAQVVQYLERLEAETNVTSHLATYYPAQISAQVNPSAESKSEQL